jgi:hypothetical protein
MKDNLDYSTEIPHLSEDTDAKLKVSVTNYEDGPKLTVHLPLGYQQLNLSKDEIQQLREILFRYELAHKILQGEL